MKRKGLLFVTSIFCAVIILVCVSPVAAQKSTKTVTLNLLSSWSRGYAEVEEYIIPWMSAVEKATGGQVKIRWMGGPEAVHPFEQLKAVQKGLCDILYTHPAYHPETVPAGQASDLIYATPKLRIANGFDTMINEVYQKRAGVKCLQPFPTGYRYQLFVNTKIRRADLTGLKIRATPFYVPVVAGLGGATVQTATGEIYDAMSTGVIDGYCSPQRYPVAIKLYEVTKFGVAPRFGEVVFITLVNINNWNSKLSKEQQSIIDKVTNEVVEKQRAITMKKTEEEIPKLLQHGMTLVELPKEESAKMLRVFRDKSWEELIMKKDPQFGPKLRAIADKIEKTK